MTADLITGIVRILARNGTTAGAGFLVTDDGLIVTCAHVVEAAGAGPGDTVRVVFHAADKEHEAQVESDWWRAPNAEDVAILRLERPLPEGVTPVTLGASIGTSGNTFRAFGYPRVGDFRGVWAEGRILGQVTDEHGVTMLQLRAQEIASGMSGAPVLNVSANRVVGMVTTTYQPDATLKFRDAAFAIPAETLRDLCPDPLTLQPAPALSDPTWYAFIEPLVEAPISDAQRVVLEKEFYAGVQARYEHILGNLDFRRDHKMTEIHQAFQKHNVVIVHAASGQGKTTLAYRYLHDTYPEERRFVVKRVQDVEQALKIAQAFSELVNTVQSPVAIYVDVNPRDMNWPELVKNLSRHPSLETLITVREDDYRRANISGAGFTFSDVELVFDQDEARLIYEYARSTRKPLDFLDFDEAWDKFGRQGPLMEFVYLLTQTQTLRERLQSQIHRIQQEVRMGASPGELQLLRLVAVASAYGARLNTLALIKTLNLPAPDHTLNQLEKEYLIRRSGDGQCLEGVHPIRSGILCELLVKPDTNPWLEVATQALFLMLEEDWETFILHAFVDRPAECQQLLDAITSLRPTTWQGVADMVRCLLWAGVKDYVDVNHSVIDAAYEAFGPAWQFALDLNFSPQGEVPDLGEWWTTLGDMVSSERQAQIKALRQSQTSKDTAFQLAMDWLMQLENKPAAPCTPDTWVAVADVWYWSARLIPQRQLVVWVSEKDLNAAVEHLPLATLADLSLALYRCDPQQHERWLEVHRTTLHRRLAQEYNILALEQVATTLKSHFIPSGIAKRNGVDPLHAETMEGIDLVRRLFPNYEQYGAQGYGFKPVGIALSQGDSTQKEGVPIHYLPPKWSIRLNGIASGLVYNLYRPDNWEAYLDKVVAVRQVIVDCLAQLNRGLVKYFQRDKPINVGLKCIDVQAWQHCWDILSASPSLPKSAVDPWGFAHEGTSASFLRVVTQQARIPSAIALQKYKDCLSAQRDYFSSIRNFIGQAGDVWVTNFNAGKLRPNDPRKSQILATLEEKGVKTDPYLSVLNLLDAKAALCEYQQEFMALFGQSMEESHLDTLEQREREVLSTTWALWYFYAYEPWKLAASPRSQVPNWMTFAKRDLDRQIQQALTIMETPACQVTRLHFDHCWREHPALWIRLDLDDPTELYNRIETFPVALRDALGPVNFDQLPYFLIQEHYAYTVVIPVVRGRMLNELVWPFYTPTLLRQDESKSWTYTPQPLPNTIREALGIVLWDVQDIAWANQLSLAIATLMQLSSQMGEFQSIPEMTEAGGERLQQYIDEEVSNELGVALQTFFDIAAVLLDRFNALSKSGQQDRTKLRTAVEALIDIHKRVRPAKGDGVFRLGIEELGVYSRRLQEIYATVEGIRLFWVADILDQAVSQG